MQAVWFNLPSSTERQQLCHGAAPVRINPVDQNERDLASTSCCLPHKVATPVHPDGQPPVKLGLTMAFKLMMSAMKKWRKLDGQNRLPEIIRESECRDGIRQLGDDT